jgi:prepilin-type N-terminal cleavage/methylation domain-containing protein
MKRRAGFTIIELLITITIMGILLVLGVVNLRGSQANGRDEERKTDIKNTALYLEGIYDNGIPSNPAYKGSYPPTTAVSNTTNISTWFPDIDMNNLRSPGIVAPAVSITPATSNVQTIAGVTPQPTQDSYVYQPIDSTGALCTSQGDCRKYNLYYKLESNPTIQMVLSKNQ